MVVTGTSTGIGRAIALSAARADWRVLATVRDPSAGHSRIASGSLMECGCVVAGLDLRDGRSIATFAAGAEAWCGGKLDALVNNAGTALAGPVEELDMAAVREHFEVNVFGHVDITQRLLPALRAAHGRVLIISSERARVPVPLYGAYVASKRALEGFAAALEAEVEPLGVRATTVSTSAAARNGSMGVRATTVFTAGGARTSSTAAQATTVSMAGGARTSSTAAQATTVSMAGGARTSSTAVPARIGSLPSGAPRSCSPGREQTRSMSPTVKPTIAWCARPARSITSRPIRAITLRPAARAKGRP
jgi:NAD(P)-dependent dehydrogenase (short-subunit alcohol dehydrogenase family)